MADSPAALDLYKKTFLKSVVVPGPGTNQIGEARKEANLCCRGWWMWQAITIVQNYSLIILLSTISLYQCS